MISVIKQIERIVRLYVCVIIREIKTGIFTCFVGLLEIDLVKFITDGENYQAGNIAASCFHQ